MRDHQFYLIPKAYSHSVGVRFIRDVFLISGSKKTIMQFQMVLGMISKNETASEFHSCEFQ